jgi:hypothetical protein
MDQLEANYVIDPNTSLSLTDKKGYMGVASPTIDKVFKLNNPDLILAEVQAHNIFTPPLQNSQNPNEDSFRL